MRWELENATATGGNGNNNSHSRIPQIRAWHSACVNSDRFHRTGPTENVPEMSDYKLNTSGKNFLEYHLLIN